MSDEMKVNGCENDQKVHCACILTTSDRLWPVATLVDTACSYKSCSTLLCAFFRSNTRHLCAQTQAVNVNGRTCSLSCRLHMSRPECPWPPRPTHPFHPVSSSQEISIGVWPKSHICRASCYSSQALLLLRVRPWSRQCLEAYSEVAFSVHHGIRFRHLHQDLPCCLKGSGQCRQCVFGECVFIQVG
jgi:hypothetical protein